MNTTVKFFIAFFWVFLFSQKNLQGQSDTSICQASVTALKNVITSDENFFVKVHAAENLIYHGYIEGLEGVFLDLLKNSPETLIGCSRVLARLNREEPEKYKHYTHLLLTEFRAGNSRRISLTALESLAKLGYSKSEPSIKGYSDTGTIGFKGMATWVLSNNNTGETENKLSGLLLSNDIFDYKYAAYALRFKSKTNRLTVVRLKDCLARLTSNDDARVYVAASLFVNGGGNSKRAAKKILISYINGTTGQKYELAEALGIAGSKADLPILKKLFADENTDVRVAAANAQLRLSKCKKINETVNVTIKNNTLP
jgi:hypothetical protein